MSIVLRTTNLCKKYGNKMVSDNISITINKGDIYGFVGRNGAGKTTLMRQILGLAQPTSGAVQLFEKMKLVDARKKIGSLIESPAIYKNCSAYENMKRFAILTGNTDEEIRGILDYVGLGNTGKKKAGQFSLGMCQRLGIAIALLGNPEFLVLDEPINGLDPKGIMEVRDLILKLNKEKGITFMISSHLLEELSKIATCYGFISDGKIIEEITAKELYNKCADRIKVVVNRPEKAIKELESFLPKELIHLYQGNVYIDSVVEQSAKINKFLIDKGFSVNEIFIHSISLEEYFLRKVDEQVE